ncbi:hypothetical protein BGZ96_004456 [Linnemannia gamsii]|uniref:Uncharacterized protein n=1 Tax=Linnemannia gamsii TaxID=64522 RepID=A0ABQ7K6Z4_9FUNG|nr:hypothetical protein BGZ96_004456 [Linnemannia gamsii]
MKTYTLNSESSGYNPLDDSIESKAVEAITIVDEVEPVEVELDIVLLMQTINKGVALVSRELGHFIENYIFVEEVVEGDFVQGMVDDKGKSNVQDIVGRIYKALCHMSTALEKAGSAIDYKRGIWGGVWD